MIIDALVLSRLSVRQCVIYDSDKPDARLIGIEYVIDESVFVTLDHEEKKLWHSHKFEVESGTLQLGVKALVPKVAVDCKLNQVGHCWPYESAARFEVLSLTTMARNSVAEQQAMKELHHTYGKSVARVPSCTH